MCYTSFNTQNLLSEKSENQFTIKIIFFLVMAFVTETCKRISKFKKVFFLQTALILKQIKA